MTEMRNLAIIAHVDHGKTTLVDALLRQSGTFRENQKVAERVLDSNELEKERGITILSKCTSVLYKNIRFNIVDTPGHADFGGEVERILNMVDGVLLLVDSVEGPMPQTKFVTAKALNLGLNPIVVINKVDRADAMPDKVIDQVFDLFLALGASDEQLNFPILYASAKDGWASRDLAAKKPDLSDLFEVIKDHVPVPTIALDAPFSMLVTTLEYDSYLGRILTGRVYSGTAKVNMPVKVMTYEGEVIEQGRLAKLLAFRGLERSPVDVVEAGDIVAIAGLSKATVAHTICDPSVKIALPAQPIDPPTISMTFSVNTSPLAGLEGDKLTSRMIQERLQREAEGNVALTVSQNEEKDSFDVAGRGELQLSILIETMRREGFELTIGRPRVILKKDSKTGETLEPIEEVQIDVDEAYAGVVIESLGLRKGEMVDMQPSGGDKTRLVFHIPSRGLIGYHNQFMTETRGTGILNRLFYGYAPYKGPIEGRRNGVLISNTSGETVAYALFNLEDRGVLFVEPGTRIYEGMIIGEHNRPNDLEVNPMKGKQLTNIRAAGKDEALKLTPPRLVTLERALAYIEDDEVVEVTPKNVRLRKKFLDPHERKRQSRQQE